MCVVRDMRRIYGIADLEEAFVLRAPKNTPEVQCYTEHMCYWTVGWIKKAVYCFGVAAFQKYLDNIQSPICCNMTFLL